MTTYRKKRRGPRRAAAIVIGSLALASTTAAAGGLGRPNTISARSVGMGGAFVAVADDASALHFNPAGMALQARSSVMIGGELVLAPRTYTPAFADGTCRDDPEQERCEKQSPEGGVIPVPVLGFVHRLRSEGVPSRLSFGIGLWNTYGGQLKYEPFDDKSIRAFNETQNAVFELVPGIAYEVNDLLAVGMAIRVGFGLFKLNATAKPINADLSGEGFGVGGTLGVIVRPSPSLNIGLVYRTGLTNEVTGGGELETSPTPVDMRVQQSWPQSAGVGLAWRASQRILLAAELDWTNWQRLNKLVLEFPGKEELNQVAIFDWNDSYSAHVGTAIAASDGVEMRLGLSYDTAAVPVYTQEREHLDGDKLSYNGGASFALGRGWRLDAAIEVVYGSPQTIEDNRADLRDWRNPSGSTPESRANPAPGEHVGHLFTAEIAAHYLF